LSKVVFEEVIELGFFAPFNYLESVRIEKKATPVATSPSGVG
jgi:hypothetical protein